MRAINYECYFSCSGVLFSILQRIANGIVDTLIFLFLLNRFDVDVLCFSFVGAIDGLDGKKSK